jgi:hypothetical protein
MQDDTNFIYFPCVFCLKIFRFRADFVPRINGEPVCGECMRKQNNKAEKRGSLAHFVHPLAYE